MVEQREIGHMSRAIVVMPEGHELNYTRTPPPSCFSPEDSKDSFQVVPVRLSQATNLSNQTKSSRLIDTESIRKLPPNKAETGNFINTANENGKRQKSNPFPTQHGKTPPPQSAWRTETANVIKTEDLSDWLLLGKSMILDPGCSSAKKANGSRNIGNEDYFLPSRKAEESSGNLCTGLHTYPPSIEKCRDPEHFAHTRKLNSENDNYLEDRRPSFPSYSSRPLGELPCTTRYTEWQRLQNKKKLEGFITARKHEGHELSQRPAARDSGHLSFRPASYAELRRTSSASSGTLIKQPCGRLPRSRSASLPAQNKLDYRVVFDWKEKRDNGITYVTPFFQNFPSEAEANCEKSDAKMDTSS